MPDIWNGTMFGDLD